MQTPNIRDLNATSLGDSPGHVPHGGARAPSAREVLASCAVLVVAHDGSESIARLLAELEGRPAGAEGVAVILWHVEPHGSSSLIDTTPPRSTRQSAGGRVLADATRLERGEVYLVPPGCRLWFEGHLARVAAHASGNDRVLDQLLLTMAEVWGDRGSAVVALPMRDDGECGTRILRAVGGRAWHCAPGGAPSSSFAKRGTAASTSSPQDRRSAPPTSRSAMDAPAVEQRALALHSNLMERLVAACRGAVRSERRPVRVWVPGCKTGGTAYLVAMWLSEAAAELSHGSQFSVHGTDLDERAVMAARLGRYPARAALDMNPRLRERYTFDEGDAIRVSERIRANCRFSKHDVSSDLPLARVDLIVAHGVFSALSPESRAELLQAFHFSVRAGGTLLALDGIDSVPEDLFEARPGQGLWVARSSPARHAPAARVASPASPERAASPDALLRSFARAGAPWLRFEKLRPPPLLPLMSSRPPSVCRCWSATLRCVSRSSVWRPAHSCASARA